MLNTDLTTSAPPPAAPATKMPEVVAPPSKPARKMLPNNFKVDISGFVTTIWWARMEEADTLDDVMRPDYWSHVAQKVDPITGRGHLIKLVNFDDSMMAFLVIRTANKTSMRVGMLIKPEFYGPKDIREGGQLIPRWNVGARSYEVIRESDKTVIGPRHPTKEDALDWIADHNKKMAA